MNRLDAELRRVLGDPPRAPQHVVHVAATTGADLDEGRAEADRLADEGVDLVVLDAPTETPAALAALALLLDLEPVAVVPPAASAVWREQVIQVRALCRTAKPVRGQPTALLGLLDDPVLNRVVGLLTGSAARRTAVLCGGGTTTAAAALVAAKVATTQWWLPGSVPVVPAAASAWRSLGLEPLLDLGLTDGSTDVALAVVRAGWERLGA